VSANIYNGGIIGATPTNIASGNFSYPSGIFGVGENGITYSSLVVDLVPAVVSSAAVWLDASDLSTITEAGGSVSQWDNKGTLGNFTQGTGASQPTTGVSTLNGLNVLDFAADFLVSADTAATYKFLHDGTKHLIAAVWKAGAIANPNTFYVLYDNHNASSSGPGGSIVWDDRASLSRNERVNHRVARNSAPLAVNNLSGDGAYQPNAFKILTVTADPGNGTAANRSNIFVDTGSAIANNTATDAPSTSDPTRVLHLGKTATDNFPLTGSIAELVIVSGADATEGNRVIIRDYLNAKWGVY
jgi:hypothetical protein